MKSLHSRLGLVLGGALLTLANPGTYAADTAIITVTTTVTAPTCTMTVPTTVDFNTGRPIIYTTDLEGEGIASSAPIAIKFTGCTDGSYYRTPKITVSGRTITLGGTELYFATAPVAGTPANGYGVKLSVSSDSNFVASSNIATVSGTNGGGAIVAQLGKSLASLNNTTLNVTANLSCGSYSPCTSAPSHAPGAFRASATFQLAYD